MHPQEVSNPNPVEKGKPPRDLFFDIHPNKKTHPQKIPFGFRADLHEKKCVCDLKVKKTPHADLL